MNMSIGMVAAMTLAETVAAIWPTMSKGYDGMKAGRILVACGDMSNACTACKQHDVKLCGN